MFNGREDDGGDDGLVTAVSFIVCMQAVLFALEMHVFIVFHSSPLLRGVMMIILSVCMSIKVIGG